MSRRSLLKRLRLQSRWLRLPLPRHSLLRDRYIRRRNQLQPGRRKALLAVPQTLRREDLRARRTRRARMAVPRTLRREDLRARRTRKARMAVPQALHKVDLRARRTRRAPMAARRIRKARMVVPRVVLRRERVRQAASTARQEGRQEQAVRGPRRVPS